MYYLRYLLLALCVSGLTACTPGNSRVQDLSHAVPLSGIIASKDGQLWFQPCQERLWWPVVDGTDLQELDSLYQRFTDEHSVELYTEFKAAVNTESDNELQVYQVDLVGGGRDTCHFSLNGLEYRAASSTPYWVADIRSDRISVKSVNPMGSYNFFAEKRALIKGDNREVFHETTPVRQPMSIVIIPERCTDPVNGTILPFRAELNLFGQLYRGCARKGHSKAQRLTGLYWTEWSGHQAMFRLLPDNRVQLARKDISGSSVTEKGRWQYLESGKLILSMRDSQQKEFIVLLRQQSDGSFKLQTPEQKLAPNGTHFMRWQPSGLEGGKLLNQPVTDAKAVQAALPLTQFSESAVTPARVGEAPVNEIRVNEIKGN